MPVSSRVLHRWIATLLPIVIAVPVALAAIDAPAQAAPVPLFPDLKTLPARELRFDRADVTADLSGDYHNVLRFSNDTYNAGEGPLILDATIDPNTLSGPATQRVMNSDGTFTDYPLGNDIYWHAAHHHYHFDNWGAYQLWSKATYDAWLASGRTSGAPLYTGAKTTSCVTDEEFVTSVPNAVYPGPYGLGGCDAGANGQIHMGLSPGWGDTYDWYRQLQWIDLGQHTLGDGTYVLRSVADPLNIVYESANKADPSRESEPNNEATTTFVVSGGTILDSDPPTGTVTIDHVDTLTSTPNVSVDVIGRDDVSEPDRFRLSNDGVHFRAYDYTSSGSVPTTVAWNLGDATTGGTSANGVKTVYAQVHDNSGKWGPTFTDTIDYEAGGTPPPAGPYAQVVAADHPAGYWRLDETSGAVAADRAGSSPGTYRGGVSQGRPSLLTSDGDLAASFSGSGQSVRVPSAAPISPASTVSVEAWVNPAALPGAGAFASIVTKPESYSLQFDGPRLEFTIMEGGARHRLLAPSGSVAVGRTAHVVGTYDGGAQRLYVNGALVASASLAGAITTNANGLNIASWDGSSEFLRGTVDEVAVYPMRLSGTQVANHYAAGTKSSSRMAPYANVVGGDAPGGYWRLDERSGPTAADSSRSRSNGGRYAGARPGAAGLLTTTPDTAAAFSGRDQSVTVPSSASLSPGTNLSVEAWVKPAALPRPGRAVAIAAKTDAYALQLLGPTLEFTVIQSGARRRVQAAGAVSVGNVAHVVGTYNGVTQRLYVNGALVASSARHGAVSTSGAGFHVGSWDGSSQFFHGTIDEVAVYPRALSAAHVANHYRAGSTAATTYARDVAHARLVSAPVWRTGGTRTRRRVAVGGTTPVAVAFDDALHHAYVTRDAGRGSAAASGVTVFDTRTWRAIGQVTTGPTPGPASIAVDPVTHLVYVTSAVFAPDGVRGSVVVIDGRTGGVVRSIATGPGPKAVAVNPRTDRVYVTEQTGTDGGEAIAVFDGARDTLVATVPIGPYARYYDNPFGLAIDAASNTVYASNPLEGTVYTIDGGTNAIVRAVRVGGEPGALSADPVRGAVFAAGARGLSVISRSSGVVTRRRSSGARIRAVAVDAGHGLAYATSDRGDLVVVDTWTLQPAGAVPTGVRPSGVALDTDGRVLVAGRDDAAVVVLEGIG